MNWRTWRPATALAGAGGCGHGAAVVASAGLVGAPPVPHGLRSAADEASLLLEDGPTVLAGCLVNLAGRWQRRSVFGLLGMAGFDRDWAGAWSDCSPCRDRPFSPVAGGRFKLAIIGGMMVVVAGGRHHGLGTAQPRTPTLLCSRNRRWRAR